MKPLDKLKHPIQPVGIAEDGVHRFKRNLIVQHLLNCASAGRACDMNDIARLQFPREDREQFTMLIGYSVSGAPGLSDETHATVRKMEAEGLPEMEAANVALREHLKKVRAGLRAGVAELFDINEEDLGEGE